VSISRRHFIVGSAAGLVLPWYFEKVVKHIEKYGEPFLPPPIQSRVKLVAIDRGGGEFELNLGDPWQQPPNLTYRDYAQRYFGGEDAYLDSLGEDYCDFDAIVDPMEVIESWARTDSPNAKAFRLLESLDLGADLCQGSPVGELRFIDGACPGNDYLGKKKKNEMSLSLLQNRLNQLGTGIQVEVFGS